MFVHVSAVEILNELAAMQDADARGYLLGKAEVLVAEKHGDLTLDREPFDQLTYRPNAHRIEALRRLVENQKLRLVQQRAGQTETLKLVIGKRAHPVPGTRAKVEQVQNVVDALLGTQPEHPPLHLEILTRRHARKEREFVGQVPHACPNCRGVAVHLPAEDLHLAHGGTHQAEQHTSNGRLARTTTADQGVYHAPVDREIESIDSPHGSEVL